MPTVCWLWLQDQSLTCSWWCVLVNSFIHTMMYSYYLITTLEIKVSNKIKSYVTLSQIIQFFSGFFIVQVWFFMREGNNCKQGYYAALLSHSVNTSFIIMFIMFFVSSYGKKKVNKTEKKEEGKEDKLKEQ
jgi:hypothetical protein